jgi:hypothetical protein
MRRATRRETAIFGRSQRGINHTVFYRVFYYFERLLLEYEDRFEKEYGYFRPVIQDVFEKFLDCGIRSIYGLI